MYLTRLTAAPRGSFSHLPATTIRFQFIALPCFPDADFTTVAAKFRNTVRRWGVGAGIVVPGVPVDSNETGLAAACDNSYLLDFFYPRRLGGARAREWARRGEGEAPVEQLLARACYGGDKLGGVLCAWRKGDVGDGEEEKRMAGGGFMEGRGNVVHF